MSTKWTGKDKVIECESKNKDQVRSALIQEVASQCQRNVSKDFIDLAEELCTRYGQSVDAVILYGSCLRALSAANGVVDLYLVVNDYKNTYSGSLLSMSNAWLPPNVFYTEVNKDDQTFRVKYSIISKEDLNEGSKSWFHSYIWSRLAQPFRLLYVRDESTRHEIYEIRAASILKFLRSTIPTLDKEIVEGEDIWINGLSHSYSAELRMESKSRARQIVHENLGDYKRLTDSAAVELGDLYSVLPHGYFRCHKDAERRRTTIRLWRIRRWQGQILSVLRLFKATLTFRDCLKYAVWKINRHTDINIQEKPALQRYPILSGFNILWQLIRRGALH